MTKLQEGDAVSWNAPGGSANGHVKKKLIHDTKIKGHSVKASIDDPQYLVETDRGDKAAHKPSALKKK